MLILFQDIEQICAKICFAIPMLGMGNVILLWHSLSLPYNYFDVDLANDNVYTKFGLTLSIHSQDIEQKPICDINQGLLLPCKFVENDA